MGNNRGTIFRGGLGTCVMIPVEPAEADPIFVGHLQKSQFLDSPKFDPVRDERGHVVNALVSEEDTRFLTWLLQSSKTEWDYLRTARSKVHAMRYYGIASEDTSVFQYFACERTKLLTKMEAEFNTNLRVLPFEFVSLKRAELLYDVPYHYMWEGAGPVYLEGIDVWVDPELLLNTGTAYLLDISGWGRHGTITSDFATIWQAGVTPGKFLRGDGVNDAVDFGNVANPGAQDFMIDLWVRIQGADGTLQEILSKKADDTDTDGVRIVRTAANKVEVKISDGAASVTITSASDLLQNVWTRIGFYADRSGNARITLNGVVDGAAQDISALGDITSASNLKLMTFNGGFGQIDVGEGQLMRRLGVDGIASEAKAVSELLAHYNATKAKYGL